MGDNNMTYFVSDKLNCIYIATEIFCTQLKEKSTDGKLYVTPIKQGVLSKEDWVKMEYQNLTKGQLMDYFDILGKKKGQLRLDGFGITEKYADPIQRIDGKWVIPAPENLENYNLTNYQYTIEEYNIDWFPSVDL